MPSLKSLLTEESDYDPSWDYEVVKKPLPEVQKLVDSILRDLDPLKKQLGFHNVYVHYIKAPSSDLARYINGTMDNPHFVLNAKGIYAAAKKYGVNLGTAVETTLTHEFGHAYLEMNGIDTADHDEKVVEEFAHEFHHYRNIKTSIGILDRFVEEMNLDASGG